MIEDKRNDNEDGKIETSHEKPPQEFPAALTFPGKKSGKESDDDVDADDAYGYNLFRQPEAV